MIISAILWNIPQKIHMFTTKFECLIPSIPKLNIQKAISCSLFSLMMSEGYNLVKQEEPEKSINNIDFVNLSLNSDLFNRTVK